MKKVAAILICIVLCLCFAGESFAAASPATAPVLQETTCFEQAKKTYCTFVFKSAKGEVYRVYRRNNGSQKYTKLADVTASGATFSYRDGTVAKGKIYYYTVRRVYNNGKALSRYDVTGIKAICFDCAPKIQLTTMNATITFLTTPHAEKYTIYRKFGTTAWRAIKTLTASEAKTLTYTDVYYQSLTTAAEKKYLIGETFIDPTANPFRYEVRALSTDASGKISRGHYAKEGNCVVATPALHEVKISGKTASFVWAGVPVAKSFNLYAKTSKNAAWQKLKVVNNDGKDVQKITLTLPRTFSYYTVRAFADVRGTLTGGNYETGFSVANRKYAAKKALFLGDSIALGRPYKGKVLQYCTYSKRVEQLLGMRCDNISMTAATITDNYNTIEKQSVLIDQLRQVYLGHLPNIPAGFDKPSSLPNIWEYDYIVLQGGTNDYNASIPFGDVNSTDITTFNGALNKVKEIINLINVKRYYRGLPGVKVIVLDISYSQRCGGNYTVVESRQDKPNKLGLTATDYCEEMRRSLSDGTLNVHFIASTAILNETNCLYESSDNLHYTKVGYGKMGNIIAYTMLNW